MMDALCNDCGEYFRWFGGIEKRCNPCRSRVIIPKYSVNMNDRTIDAEYPGINLSEQEKERLTLRKDQAIKEEGEWGNDLQGAVL